MAKAEKPNILFIMGDDIGWFNVSAYNLGIMGYRTPNIDRIAREGALFTDWYAQQSGLVALEVLGKHQPAHFRMPVPGDLPVHLEFRLGGRALTEGDDFPIGHGFLEQKS